MKNCKLVMTGVVLMLVSSLAQAIEPEWVEQLAEAGAVTYAANEEYGQGIDAMVLGYDAEGQVVAGLAVRETKTYRKAPMVVLVTKQDGLFTITSASTPELKFFAGKSRDYVSEALKNIEGRSFFKADEARGLVDAVSGATAQHKAIYVSYGLMVNRLITEMDQGVNWPRQPVK